MRGRVRKVAYLQSGSSRTAKELRMMAIGAIAPVARMSAIRNRRSGTVRCW
jgi:hypothetical protein